MVANMTAISVKQHQLSAPSSKGPADHHQYACLLKTADTEADSLVTGRAGSIPLPDECSNSWEARAFAEDASSLAAGIWPPRSYPCSFCRREFRSAQALGGHMNVHRRDRARLRHSSPPPPFRAPLDRPQVSSLIQAQQHTSPTLSNPRTCPNLYPNESLSKLNSLPTARSMSSMAPATSSASLSAIFPTDITSFPLRLHILASEAASTLMFPQAEPSDLLSLWPTSTIDSANACPNSNHSAIKASSTIDISSSSLSSSSSIVAPSTGTIPCRRTGDIIQPADESPKKRSNLTNKCTGFQPYQIIKFTNFSHGAESDAHQTQIKGDEDVHIERKREDCGDVDLELRLGRRPP